MQSAIPSTGKEAMNMEEAGERICFSGRQILGGTQIFLSSLALNSQFVLLCKGKGRN